MHIKRNTNLIDFLRAANRCQEDVLFLTQDGDVLNLKSELSRYVFASLAPNAELLSSACITCKNETDYKLLANYLEV